MTDSHRTPSFVLPLVVGLAIAVIGGFALTPGLRTYRAERRELARDRVSLAKLADEARREERKARDAATASGTTTNELHAARARAAAATSRATRGPRFRWTQLVKEFRARLASRSDVNAADFRLLTGRDWLEASLNAEGADDQRLNRVITSMRYTAQKRLGEALLDVLRRWTQANGTLPPDITSLASLLPTTIDAETLARFTLARTGALEPRDQPVLIENEGAFAPLRLTLDGWSMSRKVSDTAPAAVSEDLGELARVFDEDASWTVAWVDGSSRILPKLVTDTVGEDGMEELGQDMKQAAAKYWAANGNTSPGTIADVASYLQQGGKITSAVKQIVATMQYLVDHEGAAPADPAALQPYLDAIKDTNAVLRQMKLKYDGNQVTFSFSFSP